MSRLIRLYPAAWRARYGDEMADLLAVMPPGPRDTLDLARGAAGERLRSWTQPLLQPAGGPPMLFHPFSRHPTLLAGLAFIVVLPTLALLTVSFLAYGIGLAPVARAWETFLNTTYVSRFADLFLLTAPFIAFAVAIVPCLGIGLGRDNGEWRLTVAFRPRTWNLVVIGLCIVLGGFLAAHQVVEFLFER